MLTGSSPAIGLAEQQVLLLALVALTSIGLGLGAGLGASAAGFAWLLWPAAEAGTLDTATLLRALLWFALAKGIAAAIALPRARVARLLGRLRGAETAVRQRALLLEEMSHRVRNDMQRLVGLLQSQAGTDPAAAAALTRAAGRIQVLGRVHRRLARRDGTFAVDSQAFLEGLADDLRAAMLPDTGIALTASAEAHPLPVAVAGDVGLVVNELVTNALKYAFPRDRGGVVRIGFGREGDLYRLAIADNGVGLGHARLDTANGGSGMRLVRALAAQLGGRLEVQAAEVGGTLCVLWFPVTAEGGGPVTEEGPPAADDERQRAAGP